MKKLLLVFTVAAFLTACNSSTSNTEAKTTDSSVVVTPAPTAPSDSVAVMAPAVSDSAAKMDSTKK